MNKNTCVFYAPVDSYSGYSGKSRETIKAIIELRKNVWDIKIISCNWGNTPTNFLSDNEEEWGWVREYILQGPLTYKPDYMFFITIPTEARVVGKWNCSINSGIETTLCDGSWIESMNQMDANWVPSNHAKNVYQSLIFNKVDQQGKQLGQLKLEKPIEVVFEGSNTQTYFPIQGGSDFDLQDVKEEFCFLSVGMWLPGDFGHDRKNIGLLVKLFYETFKNTSNPPALILKTSTGNSSYSNKDEILKRILKIRKTVEYQTLPNIYLFNGNITDMEMNDLYNHPKVKAMVSLSKGEGLGKPLLEFSMANKPIITTNWSGQTDFLDPSLTTLLPGELKQVHPSSVNQWILKDAKWFEVDQQAAMTAMKGVFNNYKNYQTKAIKQGYINRNKFSYEKMKQLIDKLLKEVPVFPVYEPLKLPTLTKIN